MLQMNDVCVIAYEPIEVGHLWRRMKIHGRRPAMQRWQGPNRAGDKQAKQESGGHLKDRSKPFVAAALAEFQREQASASVRLVSGSFRESMKQPGWEISL